jgi:hypothetical protein
MPDKIPQSLVAQLNTVVAVSWWNRVEPRPRTPEVADTLAAKVRDPLWMLTRQWQFGEFQGEDAASPAWVQLAGGLTNVVGWRVSATDPDAQPAPLAALTAPLEEEVETESFTADLAVRAELGLLLGQLLDDQGLTAPQRDKVVAAARADFSLDTTKVEPGDAAAMRFSAVCGDRALDGIALAGADAAAVAALVAKPDVAPFAAKVKAAIKALQDEVAGTLGAVGTAAGDAWRTERLEYEVEVAVEPPEGQGSLLLRAQPDRDATFEWYTMDLESRGSVPATPAGVGAAAAGGEQATFKQSLLPTFVRFRGMPNHRFWDFERGSSDYGAVIPDKRDLAKLLVADFMLIHGNDYFVVPLDQPVGTAARISELVVHDVFGGRTLVPRADATPTAPDARWTCFSTSVIDEDGAPADFFLIPPSAGPARLAGEAIEDVRFVRDEQANLVWAIEQSVEGGDGRPWLGRARHVAATQGEPAEIVPASAAPLLYRLQSFVPWHWFPMLPVSLSQVTGETILERGQMVRPDGVTKPQPLGRLLAAPPESSYRVREETIPRTGLRLVREVVRARWMNGETHLWIARRKLVGRGEGSSGLRYDEARIKAP